MIYGKDHHYKIASGLDATGDEGTAGDAVGMWSNGQSFTFWAYGNAIEGATAYHVYYNNKSCCTGEENDTQRFTLSKNKQNEDDDLENLWIHDFTFWAFEDVRVQKFLGTALYNRNQMSIIIIIPMHLLFSTSQHFLLKFSIIWVQGNEQML